MSNTIFLTISAAIYTAITTYIFFSKDKIDKIENRIFERLLLSSLFSMIMELILITTKNIKFLGTIIEKIFLIIHIQPIFYSIFFKINPPRLIKASPLLRVSHRLKGLSDITFQKIYKKAVYLNTTKYYL